METLHGLKRISFSFSVQPKWQLISVPFNLNVKVVLWSLFPGPILRAFRAVKMMNTTFQLVSIFVHCVTYYSREWSNTQWHILIRWTDLTKETRNSKASSFCFLSPVPPRFYRWLMRYRWLMGMRKKTAASLVYPNHFESLFWRRRFLFAWFHSQLPRKAFVIIIPPTYPSLPVSWRMHSAGQPAS